MESTGEAPYGKPRDIFAEPCEAGNAIPPCVKPQGFLAKKGKSLKSALDLAMERLAQRDGAPVRLTDAQKAALAEVDCKTKAKLAEREILGNDRLAKAGEDPEKVEPIKTEQRIAIEKIRARAEQEKERIRKGAASDEKKPPSAPAA